MLTKQMAEELRYYARSERHLQALQTWLDTAKPSYPASVASGGSDVVQTKLFPLLKTQTLGGAVLFSPALASTQTLLHETLQPSAPAGLLCYTELQTSGKGRGSNTWSSPEGCLTFSFKSAFVDGNTLPFVQYLVSLAIIKAVETVHAVSASSNPDSANTVRIKWPNDIYANKVKIGGILCQSEYRDGKFSVTTGSHRHQHLEPGADALSPGHLGHGAESLRRLQVSLQPPTAIAYGSCIDNGLSVCREEFLAAFCNAYEPMEELFREKGFEPFMADYLARWLHTNQVVQVASGDDGSGAKMPAVIKGLTSTGCLLAEADGSRLELYPDGNSFDFLSGLLKRKL
ncbi:hypothetical protein BBJ28_00014739 [Nothophytophthora sp. Chile5]|nr:hypothetical protein BBJ28_00014739 [Nothophytophthora sp. Chile5]